MQAGKGRPFSRRPLQLSTYAFLETAPWPEKICRFAFARTPIISLSAAIERRIQEFIAKSAEAIAQELNRPLTEVWYRTNFGKRATRVTLLAKQCDFSVGLPGDSDFMGPALIFSRPFMKAGYALVLKKPATVSSWADLNGKAIAVQQNSTPQNFLATKDNITMVTELNPEETVKAVASGAADAAFVWAPTAGYVNKTLYSDSFNIIPVDGAGMQWPVAVAFGKRDGALRDAVNGVLNRISAKVDDLKVKYGFPAGEPVTLAEGSTPVKEAMKAPEQTRAPDKSAENATGGSRSREARGSGCGRAIRREIR